MSVLLPWDRKKPAEKGQARDRRPPFRSGRRLRLTGRVAMGAFALVLAVLVTTQLLPSSLEIIWNVPGGRVVSDSSGGYLIATGGVFWLMGPDGTVAELGPLGGDPVLGAKEAYTVENGRLIRAGSGSGRADLAPAAEMEQAVFVLDGGTVLTARPLLGKKFGEQWALSARATTGALLWTAEIPGAPSLVCHKGERLAVAATDLSSGGLPAVISLDAGTGKIAWIKGLQGTAWRGLGILADGTTVAVLDAGVTAVKPAGPVSWSYAFATAATAAAIADDAICVSIPVSQGFFRFVYPYEVRVYLADGTVLWAKGVRQRPLRLQCLDRQALVALTENHVVGFDVRDGRRLYAEKTGAFPVSLTGDAMLLRDGQGIRLARFRRPGGVS